VLWQYLKQYVDKKREGNELLKLAAFSYNTSIHENTKFSPHELVFGKKARIPTSDPILSSDLTKTYADLVKHYLTSLFGTRKKSQEKTSIEQKSKFYYKHKM